MITEDGIDRLFAHYQGGLRGELRWVLRIARVALADACDSGADATSAVGSEGTIAVGPS